jgi:hypothetical protein
MDGGGLEFMTSGWNGAKGVSFEQVLGDRWKT